MTFIENGYWAYLIIGVCFTIGGGLIYGGTKLEKDELFLRCAATIIGAIIIFVGIGLIIS